VPPKRSLPTRTRRGTTCCAPSRQPFHLVIPSSRPKSRRAPTRRTCVWGLDHTASRLNVSWGFSGQFFSTGTSYSEGNRQRIPIVSRTGTTCCAPRSHSVIPTGESRFLRLAAEGSRQPIPRTTHQRPKLPGVFSTFSFYRLYSEGNHIVGGQRWLPSESNCKVSLGPPCAVTLFAETWPPTTFGFRQHVADIRHALASPAPACLLYPSFPLLLPPPFPRCHTRDVHLTPPTSHLPLLLQCRLGDYRSACFSCGLLAFLRLLP